MKKLTISSVLSLLCCFSFAQTKAVKIAKISLPTIQCDLCKSRIEEYVKRMDGVSYVNVAVKKKEVTVKYLTDRTNEENIKTAIANAGYDAAEIAANTDSYKLLPKCCKKPSDGGGMPKQ